MADELTLNLASAWLLGAQGYTIFSSMRASSIAASTASRIGFYVKPNGITVPATGYRALVGPGVAEAQSGVIASRRPTYITFNNITRMTGNEVKDMLQMPVIPTHSATFDTLQLLDGLRIPSEYWNTGLFQEPFAVSFPKWGQGGGSQAITDWPIFNPIVTPFRR
jgi:hypothetical protein